MQLAESALRQVAAALAPLQNRRLGSRPRSRCSPHSCPGCGYIYDVVTGDEREGFAAGTAWADIPDTWCCPDCGVRDKVDFVPVEPVAV